MSGYTTNIEEKTLWNENFREVLYTAQHSQLVVMSLQPNEEIGSEKKLKLYTIYSPAHHKDKTIHNTKQDALADTQDYI